MDIYNDDFPIDNNKTIGNIVTVIPSPNTPESSQDPGSGIGRQIHDRKIPTGKDLKESIRSTTGKEKDDRRVSFHIPKSPKDIKNRPQTAIYGKSGYQKTDVDKNTSRFSNIPASAEPHHHSRPQSAPGRTAVVDAQSDQRVFDNYLECLLVVNFEKNDNSKREFREGPSSRSSSRVSNRAFERAFRGRPQTGLDISHKLNKDQTFSSGIIGTGTAIRPKTANATTDHRMIIKKETTNTINIDETSDLSLQEDMRPFTAPNIRCISQKRSQTVRENVDKFQIEKITLRRLRYVIENHCEAQDHLQMIEMLDASNIPSDIIQSFFGAQIQSLHDIRILILQGIDNIRRQKEKARKLQEQIKKYKMVGMNLNDDELVQLEQLEESQMNMMKTNTTNVIGRNPICILPTKEKPTTPKEILSILKSVETKRGFGFRKFAPLRGGGSASYARKSAKEANQSLKDKIAADDDKKSRWKPVTYRKRAQSESAKTKSAKGSGKYDTAADKLVNVSVLSPKNIVRMAEGKKPSIFQ